MSRINSLISIYICTCILHLIRLSTSVKGQTRTIIMSYYFNDSVNIQGLGSRYQRILEVVRQHWEWYFNYNHDSKERLKYFALPSCCNKLFISDRLNENIYIVRSRWTLVFHLRTHDLLHGQHTKRMLKGRKEMYVVSFRDVVP